jgi:hypothetical protein
VNSKLDVVVPHRINIIKSPGSTSFAGFLYCITNINIATAQLYECLYMHYLKQGCASSFTNQHVGTHSHCSPINACKWAVGWCGVWPRESFYVKVTPHSRTTEISLPRHFLRLGVSNDRNTLPHRFQVRPQNQHHVRCTAKTTSKT